MAKRPEQTPAGETIAQIVRLLFDVKADKWTMQEKGVLTAAIKLALLGDRDGG